MIFASYSRGIRGFLRGSFGRMTVSRPPELSFEVTAQAPPPPSRPRGRSDCWLRSAASNPGGGGRRENTSKECAIRNRGWCRRIAPPHPVLSRVRGTKPTSPARATPLGIPSLGFPGSLDTRCAKWEGHGGAAVPGFQAEGLEALSPGRASEASDALGKRHLPLFSLKG